MKGEGKRVDQRHPGKPSELGGPESRDAPKQEEVIGQAADVINRGAPAYVLLDV